MQKEEKEIANERNKDRKIRKNWKKELKKKSFFKMCYITQE
jgi:hypothetical protein